MMYWRWPDVLIQLPLLSFFFPLPVAQIEGEVGLMRCGEGVTLWAGARSTSHIVFIIPFLLQRCYASLTWHTPPSFPSNLSASTVIACLLELCEGAPFSVCLCIMDFIVSITVYKRMGLLTLSQPTCRRHVIFMKPRTTLLFGPNHMRGVPRLTVVLLAVGAVLAPFLLTFLLCGFLLFLLRCM